ncbi:MAG: class I SAM-dependent methyltransferase [Acidimicrobiia bacterium]
MGGTFVYDECAGCESLSLRSVPDDLSEYYPAGYYSYGTKPELSVGRRFALRALLFRAGGRHLAPLAPGRYRALARGGVHRDSRILDVGGGDGRLVDELRSAGLEGDSTVVDPYATADRTALGSPIVRDELTSVTGTFDIVMFHHSLEHHDDPRATLRAAHGLLAHDGALVVRMPTVSSECWRRYGVHWIELDAPRHLVVPSEQGLTRLLGDVGFRVERSWRDGESFQLWGSELYRRGVAYVGADPRTYFSPKELRRFARETRRLNRIGEGGRLALIARKA